jgi:hypothetical protein
MKRRALTILLLGLIVAATAGCREQARVEEAPDAGPKPVVDVPPAPTRTFEEGYTAGFELGTKRGVPRAKLPEPADVERIATEEATGHPDRTERWQRGFIDGYTEGFTNVVTGKK